MSELAHLIDPSDDVTWTPEMHRKFEILSSGPMTTGQARETVLRTLGRNQKSPTKTVAQAEPQIEENRYIAPENRVPGDDAPAHVMAEHRTPRDFKPISEEDRAAREQGMKDSRQESV